MDEILEAIGAVLTAIATAIAVVIKWMFVGFCLGVYYTFHPHNNYRNYLN